MKKTDAGTRKGKRCAAIYSGGKDGHLALARAVERGYSVSCLINIDGGARHREYFTELRKTGVVRLHARLLGMPLFVWKAPSDFSPKKLSDLLPRLLGAVRSRYAFDVVVSGALEGDEGVNASDLKNAGKRCGFMVETLCRGASLESAARELMRRGMRAVIVGVDREVGMEWLGRPLDGQFLAHARRLRAAGKKITSNSVQTTVVESPLFRGRVKIVSQKAVAGRFLGFLRMKTAAGRQGPRSGEGRPCP